MGKQGKFVFGVLAILSLACNLIGCGVVSSQKVSDPDLQIATQQLKKTVDQMPQRIVNFPVYSDRRTLIEKQEIQKFSQAWAKVDLEIAPFLGKRQIINQHRIYPSHIQRQVCIIESYWQSETNNGIRFSTGTVKNGKIFTTENQVVLIDRGYVGVISIEGNHLQLDHVLPFPLPLKRDAVYDILSDNREILQKFAKAECSETLP